MIFDTGGAASVAGTLVGRERELAELRRALTDAMGGRGSLSLLVGDPGIGKTRLADELAADATRAGMQVLWGRCTEDGGAPAYWPWIQVIRTLLRKRDPAALLAAMGSGAARIAQIVPELHEQLALPDAPAPSMVVAEHARFPLFDALCCFLLRTAASVPLMIVLDDLHAADSSSLRLLEFVARELREAPLLLLGTYRAVAIQRQPEHARILGNAGRHGHHIPLGGLGEADVAQLITNTLAAPASAALVHTVYRTTEGNPFFVDEVGRLLRAEGLPSDASVRQGAIRIPHGIREAVRQRLQPLGEACQHTLRVAAVLGREFDVMTLQTMCAPEGDRVMAALNDALVNGIVEPVTGAVARYRFTHALIRATLYDMLPAQERVQLHRRAGDTLEQVAAADGRPRCAELAYHFYCAAPAGEVDKAVRYASAAGEEAARQLAYEDAADDYERALQALAVSGKPAAIRECELLLQLGEAQTRSWNTVSAQQTFERAAQVAREVARTEAASGATLLARAALGFGGAGIAIPRGIADGTLVALLEEAARAIAAPDSPLRARLLARLAVELYFSDAAARRAVLSKQAVDIARRSGDAVTLAYVMSGRQFALWDSPDVDERLAVANEAIRLAGEAGDRELLWQGYLSRLLTLVQMGTLTNWAQEIDLHAGLAAELQQPRYFSMTATLRGMYALWCGRFAEAEIHAQETLASAARVQDRQAAINVALQRFVAARAQGRLEPFEAILRHAAEQPTAVPASRCMLAILQLDLGRTADARLDFERLAARDFSDLYSTNTLYSLLPWLAEVCAGLGDARRAAVVYGYLQPYAGRMITFGPRVCFGPATHYLGILAAAMNEPARAAVHFEDALAHSARLGGRPMLAVTQVEYAALLLRQAEARPRSSQACDPEQNSRPLALLSAALAAAREMEMAGLAERAAHMKNRVEATLREAHNSADLEVGQRVASASGRSSRRVLRFPGQQRRQPPAVDAEAARPPASTQRGSDVALPPSWAFRLEGEFWTVGQESQALRLKDTKGLRYIRELLRYPGREFHAVDLAALQHPFPDGLVSAASTHHLHGVEMRSGLHATAADEVLDAPAKAAYKRRLEDLRDQLDEATRFNDVDRMHQLRTEMEFITHELARAVGLGGRNRRAASQAERARLNVTRAIKAVVKRITARDPQVGRMLATTIKTGMFCSHVPDPHRHIQWHL